MDNEGKSVDGIFDVMDGDNDWLLEVGIGRCETKSLTDGLKMFMRLGTSLPAPTEPVGDVGENGT